MNKKLNSLVLYTHADEVVITFECRQQKPDINLASFDRMFNEM